VSNECIPYYAGAKQITVVAGTGGIDGKRFVATSGGLAAGLGTDGGVPTGATVATSGVPVLGVGAQDTAAGLAGGVWVEGEVPVIAGAALTGGTAVMPDASGHAIAWTTGNTIAGYCMADTASGADAPIKIRE
jgi:predicted RecA/RadA family phage recombinase